jgi:penicillin-binding protein 2
MFDERAQEHQRNQFQARLRVFSYLVSAVFALVILRFYYLQIIRGSYYREQSENNRLALVKAVAPRGIIFDRNRKVLVANRASFKVSLVLEDVKEQKRTEDMLVSALDIDPEALREAVKRVGRYRQFEPLTVKEDVPRDKLAYLEAMRFQYPGLSIDVEPRRDYPENSLAAHVIGYVGEVNAAELERKRGIGYEVGDYIGKMGLEKEFNDILKGIDGGLQVEVDSLGRRLRVLNNQEPLPGYNLVLTIDRDLQKVAEEALGEQQGAVVVMDPRTGEILASVSHPAFNPNLFSVGISSEDWRSLVSDDRHPMQNRIMQSQYPPGSIFKLVTAVAGLQEGTITEDTTFYCPGGLQFGNRFFRCWKKEGHGTVNLHRAIVESCDTYFYHLGEKVGIDAIARYARQLGLGAQTGIGLPSEGSGLIPDSAWKRKTRKQPWFPGETLSAAIGQGYVLLTPIQVAVMLSALANDGDIYRPLLVKSVLAPDGKSMEEFEPKKMRHADIRPEVLDSVRRAMWGVVNEPRGTGYMARIANLDVCGKTGTAQVIEMKQGVSAPTQTSLPERQRDHAWFGGFAPLGAPRLTVVVLAEHGGHGASAAAPVAAKVMKAFFMPEKEKAPSGEIKKSPAPALPPAEADVDVD